MAINAIKIGIAGGDHAEWHTDQKVIVAINENLSAFRALTVFTYPAIFESVPASS